MQQILKFKTIDEAIKRANDTSYGLAAGVITKDIDKALTVANSVQAGTVYVNNFAGGGGAPVPFGGYKMSGIGREGSEEGIKLFCEIKTVIVKIPSKNS